MLHLKGVRMKTFVNLLKLLALATIVTSCAYEPDPGLVPKVTIDNKDILSGKPTGEVLKTKYTTLTAVCSLAERPAAAPQGFDPGANGASGGNGSAGDNGNTGSGNNSGGTGGAGQGDITAITDGSIDNAES